MTQYPHRMLCQMILWLFPAMIILGGFDAKANDNITEVVRLSLVKNVEVFGDDIFLADIASIEGEDQELIEKIERISLGKSPLPGKSRRINADNISFKLKQNNIDLTSIHINGMQEIEVTRGFTTLTEKEIEQIVFQELPEVMGLDEDNFSIKEVKVANAVVLPLGKYTYTVTPAKNAGMSGKLLVTVVFTVDGKFTKKVFATVDVERYVNAVVLSVPMKRNQVIHEADIEMMKIATEKLPSNYIGDMADAVGNRLVRSLGKGSILCTEFVNMPPTINKNDVILMVAETNSFKIVTLGEAIEKGHKGERIKVKNLDSNNEVYGLVIDSKSVKVGF
ncbi:MAG: flagellar basal body P-ring formation chaperone FlgA [Desulfobacteraceae bacterium]|nr:flagellar basal body P-ring formation chaperone FlgA [Desulfobacteraceae bacterium]